MLRKKTLHCLVFIVLAACEDKTTAVPTKASDTPVTTAPAVTASQAPAASATAPPAPAPSAIPAPPDVAAAPADAIKSPTGLASKVLTKGTGKDHPTKTDKVKVSYTGWTKDGRMFDSSVTRGQPISFKLAEVVKGWTEGLQLMVVGEKRRLWIPPNLAYGDTPRGGQPAGQLTFDVELLEIFVPGKPPPTPPDVKAPPKDATKTASGLAYKVLKKGTGEETPKATSVVTVNYTGWTTDGKMFDSSIPDGEPVTFPLNRVVKGWTEGLQLMHVGDQARFWIPPELGYGEKPKNGEPAGMLVFDIELVKIN